MTGSAVRVPLRWLDDAPPDRLSGGATWGVPLPRGAVGSIAQLRLREVGGASTGSGADARAENAAGAEVAAQFWPLATWPDGSVKWAGVAIGAMDAPVDYEVVSGTGASVPGGDAASEEDSSAPRVTVRHEDAEVVVANGTLEIAFALPAHGPVDTIARRLVRDGRTVSEDVRLVSLLQDEVREDGGSGPRRRFRSRVTAVEVEQDGPVRAVVRVEGVHQEEQADSAWLPFTVRFVVMAGAAEVRLVHSFVWDGDAERDFLAGLGVRADVPLRARAARPARPARRARTAASSPRRSAGSPACAATRAPTCAPRRSRGGATPPVAAVEPGGVRAARADPGMGRLTLAQLSADGFGIAQAHRARARAGSALPPAPARRATVATATRRAGSGSASALLAVAPGPARHPRRATGDRAELTAWLYSPEAPADGPAVLPRRAGPGRLRRTARRASRSRTRTTSRASATPTASPAPTS